MEYLKNLLCFCLRTDSEENIEIIADTTSKADSNRNKRLINNSINQQQFSTQENESIKIQKNEEIEKLQKKISELMQILNQKDNIINEERNKRIELERNNKNVQILKSKGLDNIGATCYMNATLQCLSNTKKLRDYFLNKYNSTPNQLMGKEFHKLVINLYNEKDHKKSYSPNSFKEVLSKENPLFAGVQANDSKDLINFLLERLHQELNILKITQLNNMNNNMIPQEDQTNENSMLGLFLQEFSQKFNSPISSLFYGLLETKSQCKGCNIIKFNFQVYSFLEFPLQQVNQYFFNLGKKLLILPNNKNPDVNLYECFEYNKKIDLMTGENQMYCNICNKLCDALYSTVLYSSPNYLIINLNRGKGAVYECNVDFPEELNIVNYLTFKQNTTFDLYAVICHLGPSSMSGHFVAYIRNQSNYKWYLYNDSIVTECSRPSQYRDGMPYILFYKVLKGGPNAPY